MPSLHRAGSNGSSTRSSLVSTIALGLGVVAVAFTFFNAFFFQVDEVRNPEELFAVERPERPGSRSEIPFTRLEYEVLRRETDVFTDVAAFRPSFPTRIDGRVAVGMFVSGNFFDMLGVAAARGRTLTPADDDGGRAVVVLEIGVRLALGATPRDIVTLVLSQSMRPIAIGVVLGGGLAAVTAIVLLSTPAAEMIGPMVQAFDPVAYAVSLGIIVATCLVAAFFAARRAAHIDPIATLRAD